MTLTHSLVRLIAGCCRRFITATRSSLHLTSGHSCRLALPTVALPGEPGPGGAHRHPAPPGVHRVLRWSLRLAARGRQW